MVAQYLGGRVGGARKKFGVKVRCNFGHGSSFVALSLKSEPHAETSRFVMI